MGDRLRAVRVPEERALMKAPKVKKPKFPFWVLRLTNLEVLVLGDALTLWTDTYKGDPLAPEIINPEMPPVAAAMLKAITTVAEKRFERSRAKKEPTE